MFDVLSDLHPVIAFIYYAFILSFTMFHMHPAALALSALAATAYCFHLFGREKTFRQLRLALPIVLLAALINPLFNHRGSTVLVNGPSGNPLTLEAILYGLAAGLLMATMILWFSSLHHVISSDKWLYLFGKLTPALALLLSMTTAFVPRFREEFQRVAQAQKGIGKDTSSGPWPMRLKHALQIFSITVSWALEQALVTSDSMQSRGYGLPGRTNFTTYRWNKTDQRILVYLLALITYCVIGHFLGSFKWYYFPTIISSKLNAYHLSVWLAYCLLAFFPLILQWKGERKWVATQSKT